ncbi:MAG: GTPase HflX [Fibrobacterales bacterium]
MGIELKKTIEKAILVGISTSKVRPKVMREHLAELQRLTETSEAEVVEIVTQNMKTYNPSTLVGKGKLEEIRQLSHIHCAELVIFDEDLSGSQIRNIEKSLPDVKVLDRSGIILDIFSKHAKTSEAQIMVEIAQHEYLMPRLTNMWTHLCRQVGGIGTRGPGETQLETDKRLVQKRIKDLKKKLQKIEKARNLQANKRNAQFHVGVVGYTNAGKSTLTNLLTKAKVLVEDKLFATLDSTTRKLFLDTERSLILSDTVGFIRKLPHHLVASFRSTLGIAAQSDLILHVIDSSASDMYDHMEVTTSVLKEITEKNIPQLLVFNKVDALDETARTTLYEKFPDAVFMSALENIGTDILKNKLSNEYDSWHSRIFDPKTEERVEHLEEKLWSEDGIEPKEFIVDDY